MAGAVEEWSTATLQMLVATKAEENQGLEFKDVAALSNKDELCRDVSAMANASGGVIVYGIKEVPKPANRKVGVADTLAGAPASQFSRDYIGQIIDSGIEPRLTGVSIRAHDLPDGTIAFSVHVPQSTTLPPHQSRAHHRYYRRYETQVLPMLDHEIRDVMGRVTAPNLVVKFQILKSRLDQQVARYFCGLEITCENLSREPALYFSLDLLFDRSAFFGTAPSVGAPWIIGAEELHVPKFSNMQQLVSLSRDYCHPKDFPIFRERSKLLLTREISAATNSISAIGYRVVCPGFASERFGALRTSYAGAELIGLD